MLNGQDQGEQKKRTATYPIICAEDSVMADAVSLVSCFAKADAPVLITGETGTGKELVARMVHSESPRSKGPFIALNCAAIPETLLESELFGHIKGAFTGAVANRRGRCELAKGGTLFLDEIGDMPLSLQPKLLRLLQEMEYEPVGSAQTQHADFRVVAATHRDLEDSVKEGQFRADLYYRLNVLQIELPALSERPKDIRLLAEHFVAKYAEQMKMSAPTISASAYNALCRHAWPGNVRELENIIYRSVVLSHGDQIQEKHFAPIMRHIAANQGQSMSIEQDLPETGVRLPSLLQSFERQYIEKALLRTDGNRAQAAQLLGINRTTLVEKLRKIERTAA